MNWNASLKELEAEATGATVFFVVLYFVIKAAVRDGINEANKTSGRAQAIAKSAAAADLPDMRAER